MQDTRIVAAAPANAAATLMPLEGGDLSSCDTEITRHLADFWQDLFNQEDGVPPISSFELMDLYKIADSLAMKDVIDGGRDFVNRYWGSKLTHYLGFEGTNLALSEYRPKELSESFFIVYRQIVERQRPVCRRAQIKYIESRNYLAYEVLHVPFRHPDDESVCAILSANDFKVRVSHDGV